MVVSNITNNHFLPEPGWSLQSDPVKYLQVKYTPNEGVRGLGWVTLTTRPDRAVTNGGSAVDEEQQGIELQHFMSSIIQLNKKDANCIFDQDCFDDCLTLAQQCWGKADLSQNDEGAKYAANVQLRLLLEVVTHNTYRP
eukprot:1918182-Pleurochrysis_carterae.AAC.1